MPMGPKEIAELRSTCQDTVLTFEPIRYGEAAQLQQHPDGGVTRVKMYDRLPLAQCLGLAAGHPAVEQGLRAKDNDEQIRANLAATVTAENPLPEGDLSPQGAGGHTDPRSAVFPAFVVNAAHMQVLTQNGNQFFGRLDTQTAISPANRFLALCMFAMQDAILGCKARGEAVDGEAETEVNYWITALPEAQKEGIQAQALADLEALREDHPLPAIGNGQGLGQEAIPAVAVNYLIAHQIYDNRQSAAAAKDRFEKNWVHSNTYGTLLFLGVIEDSLPLAADPTHSSVIGLSHSARRVYRDLLEDMRSKLEKESEAIHKVAENRFRAQILSIHNIQARSSAIYNELSAFMKKLEDSDHSTRKLHTDERQVYNKLLAKQLQAIESTQKHFDSTILGITNIQERLKKMTSEQAIIAAAPPGNPIPGIGDQEAIEIYGRLLKEHRRSINSAQGYFDARFSASKIPDLKERHEAIVLESEGYKNKALSIPDIFKTNVEAYQVYLSLLDAMEKKLDAQIKATPPPPAPKSGKKSAEKKMKPPKK